MKKQTPKILIHGEFKKDYFEELKKRKVKSVFVAEGRPTLASSKSAVKELKKHKITPVIIADNMAGFLYFNDLVKETHIAYQSKSKKEIVAQIGSLIFSILSHKHEIPVMAYEAKGKIDNLGKPQMLRKFNLRRVCPEDTKVFVPLLEEVDCKLIDTVN